MSKSLHFLDPTSFTCTNELDPMEVPLNFESPMAPPKPYLLTVRSQAFYNSPGRVWKELGSVDHFLWERRPEARLAWGSWSVGGDGR